VTKEWKTGDQAMSDPEQPATCQPFDPTVSGWWYQDTPHGESPYFWDMVYQKWLVGANYETIQDLTYDDHRILGPVPTFTEVEALQAELSVANFRLDLLRLEVVNMAALRDGDAHAFHQLDAQLTAANAEIARLKERIEDDEHLIEDRNKSLKAALDHQAGIANPYFVTVRREDLREVLNGMAKQKTTYEMSHADGRLRDFEGAYDTFVENAREALKL